MTKNIRGKIDQETLNYLDSVAQVVAGLYVEQDEVSKLGQEVSELRSAVYTLGQAYMTLYNAVLDAEEDEDVAFFEEEDPVSFFSARRDYRGYSKPEGTVYGEPTPDSDD